MNQGADGLTHRHSHYIAGNIQIKDDDRKIVLTAHGTAAGPKQRTLPLQMVVDRDGVEKSVLVILVEEVVRAGVEEICVVVWPGDEAAYADVAGDHGGRIVFVRQPDFHVRSPLMSPAGCYQGPLEALTRAWTAIYRGEAFTGAREPGPRDLGGPPPPFRLPGAVEFNVTDALAVRPSSIGNCFGWKPV